LFYTPRLQDAAAAASDNFEVCALRQSSFSADSQPFKSTYDQLRHEMARLHKQAVANAQAAKQHHDKVEAAVREGKEAAEAVRKQFEEELKRQQEKAAEDRARSQQEAQLAMERYRAEMADLQQKQLAVVQDRFAQMVSCCPPQRGGGCCSPCSSSAVVNVRGGRGYYVEEPDDCSTRRRRPETGSRQRCQGTTKKGYQCSRMAQPGSSTCYQH